MLNLDYLEELYDTLSEHLAEHPPEGEDWHPYYKKHSESFKKVIKADALTEKNIYREFKTLSEHVDSFVIWNRYEEARFANEDFLIPLDNEGWIEFQVKLQEAIVEGLQIAVEAGGMFTEFETGVVIGWTYKNPPAQDFLRTYTFDLVKGITKTTRESMRKSLLTSLKLGEDRYAATERLADIIDNRKRAAAIAHTETVRSYSEGREQVADWLYKEMNINTVKTWRDGQAGACVICLSLNGQQVNRDEMFFSELTGQYYKAPPGPHPWCKCGMSIDVV